MLVDVIIAQSRVFLNVADMLMNILIMLVCLNIAVIELLVCVDVVRRVQLIILVHLVIAHSRVFLNVADMLMSVLIIVIYSGIAVIGLFVCVDIVRTVQLIILVDFVIAQSWVFLNVPDMFMNVLIILVHLGIAVIGLLLCVHTIRRVQLIILVDVIIAQSGVLLSVAYMRRSILIMLAYMVIADIGLLVFVYDIRMAFMADLAVAYSWFGATMSIHFLIGVRHMVIAQSVVLICQLISRIPLLVIYVYVVMAFRRIFQPDIISSITYLIEFVALVIANIGLSMCIDDVVIASRLILIGLAIVYWWI